MYTLGEECLSMTQTQRLKQTTHWLQKEDNFCRVPVIVGDVHSDFWSSGIGHMLKQTCYEYVEEREERAYL
jgi:hypothetical protein